MLLHTIIFRGCCCYVLEHWYKWLLVLNGCWLGFVAYSRHDYEQENVFSQAKDGVFLF